MKTQNISEQNFNGRLYVVNKLSKKPKQCIKKEESNLLALIKKERFDLFIKQDYVKNIVNIVASTKSNPDYNAVNSIPITAKPVKYFKTAQKTIADYYEKRQYIYDKKVKLSLKERIYDFVNDVLAEFYNSSREK